MVELIGPDDGRWQALVERTGRDPYHLPGYAMLAAASEAGEPFGLYAKAGGAELLIPLVVRELTAQRDPALRGWRDATSPYGFPGLLLRGSFSEGSLAAIGHEVACMLRQQQILTCFLRMNPMSASGDELVGQLGAVVNSGETVFLDLTRSDEDLWRGYHRAHRRDIRLLQDTGFGTRANEWSDLSAFKSLYCETMQRAGARSFYFFDDRYFARLRDVLGDSLHLQSVVSPRGEVVSAGLFIWGACGTFHGHLAGTASSLLIASKLLHDAAWRWAKAHGATAFHLGGGLGRTNDTLLRFKRRFSSTTRTFRTVRMVCDSQRYQVACAAARVSAELKGFFPAYRQEVAVASAPLPPELHAREGEAAA